jgi:hypothetical protein
MFATNGRIREDGRMIHDMYVAQAKKPAESKGVWDHYHVKAVVRATRPSSRSARVAAAAEEVAGASERIYSELAANDLMRKELVMSGLGQIPTCDA